MGNHRPFVGESLPRLDARDKVTGTAKYAGDLRAEGMLFGAVVRSSLAHARIDAVDTSPARAVLGVRTVVTSAAIPGELCYGAPYRDHPVLAAERVRYVGDAVALIAAETKEAAVSGAQAVRISYSPLPAVFGVDEAMAPNTLPLHGSTNLLVEHHVERGDVQKGFAEAALVIEQTYECAAQIHAYIETEAVLAIPEGGDRLTIHAPMQNPFTVRRVVAETLGWEPGHVRVVQAETGGSFGGKNDFMYQTCAQAALLATLSGHPVLLALNREESTQAGNKRHPMRIRHRTGLDKDGLLCAADITILADAGAYAATSPFVLWRAAVHAAGPYVVPNVRVLAQAYYTNNPPSGAMRGFGTPQVMLAAELHMDLLAARSGLDPITLRRKNALRVDTETITGQKLTGSVGLLKAIEQVAAAVKSDSHSVPSAPNGAHRYGVGFACAYHGVSIGADEGTDSARARLWITDDGCVHAATGLTDLGTGTRTAHTQILSDALELPLAQVCIENSDTDICPDSGRTVSSRGTYMGGNALLAAATKMKERLCHLAAESWRVDQTRIHYKAGMLRDLQQPALQLSLSDAALLARQRGLSLDLTETFLCTDLSWDPGTGQGNAYPGYAFGACAAVVTVDVDVGKVKVLRLVSALDVGKAINPDAVRGQMTGGALMGLGYGLLEDAHIHLGQVGNLNLHTYLIPTALDAPVVDCILVEEAEMSGPWGAKGIAELATVAIAPAILNAVAHATGQPISAVPATLERVLLRHALSTSSKGDEDAEH